MPPAREKLDCFVRVITPENIGFEYTLAGPFQRLPAFLFDVGVRVVVFIGLIVVGGLTLSFVPFGGALVNVLAFLAFFVMSWFYGIYFETRFNGRTLGKMVFKLRAISTDGRPINAVQATLRNVLRLADMNVLLSAQIFSADAPPFYAIPTMLVGLVAMTFTRRMQRLGDLAAGTMVVSESVKRTPQHLQPEDLRAFGLAELIPANFLASSSLSKTIGLYMENRRRLNPMRRNDVARHLADPLIKEFSLMSDTSPDLLLCALYVRTFLSEEQQLRGRARLRETTGMSGPQLRPTSAIPTGNRQRPSNTVASGNPVLGNPVLGNPDSGPTRTMSPTLQDPQASPGASPKLDSPSQAEPRTDTQNPKVD